MNYDSKFTVFNMIAFGMMLSAGIILRHTPGFILMFVSAIPLALGLHTYALFRKPKEEVKQ